jgi:hypothetical protein
MEYWIDNEIHVSLAFAAYLFSCSLFSLSFFCRFRRWLLGQAIDPWRTGPWSNGVWKREYQNGIVLWNPKLNGQQTVSLSGLDNLKYILGSQDPTINNGASVTNGSVTLNDRDGLILLRY